MATSIAPPPKRPVLAPGGAVSAADAQAPGLPRRRPRDVRSWLRAIDWWLVAGLAVVGGALTVALLITLHKGQLLGFGDTTSHLIIPRRVLDGRQNGFRQLGVHWLPLYQALELPFAAIGPLYRSGASGVIVSFGASLLTAVLCYRLVVLVGCPRVVATCAMVMLAASPSFLYIGVVPMQPATIMAAATANVYYLTRWALAPDRPRLLIMVGLTLALATLAHFDTWILLPMEGAAVLVIAAWHSRSRVQTLATVAVWTLTGAYGFVMFLIMNVLIFGTPYAFLRGGVQFGQGAGAPPPPFQALGRTLVAYPWAAYDVAGPALVLAGLTGAVLFVLRSRRRPARLVTLLLFYPIVFYSASAFIGGNYFDPSALLQNFVHLRYAATIFPALVFFAAAGLRRPVLALAATAIVIGGAGVMLYSDSVATWADAQHENGATFVREIGPLAKRLGGMLDAHPHAAMYLPLVSQYSDRFEFLSGSSLKQYIDPNAPDWKLLRREPWRARQVGASWILLVDFDYRFLPARDALVAGDARLCHEWRFGDLQPSVALFTLDGSCPFGERPGPDVAPAYVGRT